MRREIDPTIAPSSSFYSRNKFAVWGLIVLLLLNAITAGIVFSPLLVLGGFLSFVAALVLGSIGILTGICTLAYLGYQIYKDRSNSSLTGQESPQLFIACEMSDTEDSISSPEPIPNSPKQNLEISRDSSSNFWFNNEREPVYDGRTISTTLESSGSFGGNSPSKIVRTHTTPFLKNFNNSALSVEGLSLLQMPRDPARSLGPIPLCHNPSEEDINEVWEETVTANLGTIEFSPSYETLPFRSPSVESPKEPDSAFPRALSPLVAGSFSLFAGNDAESSGEEGVPLWLLPPH